MKVTIHRPRTNSLKRLSLSLQREISAKITLYFLVFLNRTPTSQLQKGQLKIKVQ
nr:unnamed protein product [Callosobruchus analis]